MAVWRYALYQSCHVLQYPNQTSIENILDAVHSFLPKSFLDGLTPQVGIRVPATFRYWMSSTGLNQTRRLGPSGIAFNEFYMANCCVLRKCGQNNSTLSTRTLYSGPGGQSFTVLHECHCISFARFSMHLPLSHFPALLRRARCRREPSCEYPGTP